MPIRRIVALICFAAFVVMGITTSILGPTLTSMTTTISLPIEDAGILRAIQQFGSVFSTFAGGYLLGRYALRNVITPGIVLMAFGLIGIGLSTSLLLTLAASLLLGIGTGVLNVGANVAISTLFTDKAAPVLSALHTCYGIGLFCGPLIAQQILKQPDRWWLAYVLTAAACLILSVLFFSLPRLIQAPETAKNPEAPRSNTAVSWLPLIPLILLLFMYNGAGSGIADWIAPHLQLVASINASSASQVASLYGLMLTTGRAISVVALHRLGNLRALTLALTLALLGAGLIVLSGPAVGPVAVGVALVGLGFSPIYPTVIAMCGQQQPENRGIVTGMAAGIASIGGIIVPVLQGWVGAGHSGGMIVTLVCSLIMIGALTAIYRVEHMRFA